MKSKSKTVKARGKKYYRHSTAVVDQGAVVGDGSTIWHFSHISSGARLGKNCVLGQNVFVAAGVVIGSGVRIQNNVSIYEGVTLEDDVFCGPSMVFTNVINPRSWIRRRHEYRPTLAKKGASFGANCTIVCGNTIGEYSFVGAGSVVTRDVPDYALVAGVPARRKGWVCACGVKLGKTLKCPCGNRYKKTGPGTIGPAA